MSVDLNNLMQNVYDFFSGQYTAAGGSGTFLAFERIGHAVSLAEFKLRAEEPQPSPQVAEERISALVNSMLKVSPEVFSDTPLKVDDLYSMLLLGATPRAPDPASLQLFAHLKEQARKDFAAALRNSMFLGGPQFHSTLASPGDWYDASNAGNWNPYELSTSSLPQDGPPAPALRHDVSVDPSAWTLAPEATAPAETPAKLEERLLFERQLAENAPSQDVSSARFNISFKYCQVRVDRPWFYEPFLQNGQWYLPGSRAGEFSTGGLENNSGEHRFPALPIAFIAIKDLQIRADWTAEDEHSARQAIALGPFALADSSFSSRTLSSPGIQIIGWLCKVLPRLPPKDDPNLAVVPEPPGTTTEWQHVGHANNVEALAAAGGRLYNATRGDKLWVREPVMSNIKWKQLGRTKDVVAMTGLKGRLYCVSRDDSLHVRGLDPSDAWSRIGHAKHVVALAGVAGKLYCASDQDTLWMRDPIPQDVHWTRIGQAKSVVAMTATADALLFATRDGALWRRAPVPEDVPWQRIGGTPAGKVTGLAFLEGRLWATTEDNRLYARQL